jgi:head-tail adaptor
MRAGLLNSVISVEKPEVVTDEFGANTLKWV